MRIRFAPAPSGYLHLGNVRTALFNWLFARGHHGETVLRIEDTDQDRVKPEYEIAALDDLAWLGLSFDEGPHAEGAYAPYRQSERLDLYRAELERLKQAGAIYPCYCLPDELEAEREAQKKRGRAPRYSGRCRDLSQTEKDAFESGGRVPAYRLRVPAGMRESHDLVRGAMTWSLQDIADFVIMRDNGWPTYQFAVVVDDAKMNITHVIRGEDGLSNTPKQMLLYEALGYPIPQFGHLPLILGDDRQPLSKRHGDFSIRHLREIGFLPQAIVNYLALLGWSPASGAHDDPKQSDAHGEREKERLSLDELTGLFDLSHVSRSPAMFQVEKLRWFNRIYLNALADDLCAMPEQFSKVRADLAPFIDSAWMSATCFSELQLSEIIAIGLKNIDTLSQLAAVIAPFFVVPNWDAVDQNASTLSSGEGSSARVKDEDLAVLYALNRADVMALCRVAEETSHESAALSFKDWTKQLGVKSGLKGKALFQPIRLALTGAAHGIELEHLDRLLGRDVLVLRLAAFRRYFEKSVSA